MTYTPDDHTRKKTSTQTAHCKGQAFPIVHIGGHLCQDARKLFVKNTGLSRKIINNEKSGHQSGVWLRVLSPSNVPPLHTHTHVSLSIPFPLMITCIFLCLPTQLNSFVRQITKRCLGVTDRRGSVEPTPVHQLINKS